MPQELSEAAERLLDVARRWAMDRHDLRAMALVGSWARGAARADSDVDLVLLTDNTAAYLEDRMWLAAFAAKEIARRRKWGVVTELRAVLGSGLEVEFGITSPKWASTSPVDPGTRRVVSEGLVALHDPDGLLAKLDDVVSTDG